jgi:hypothetical protein
MAPSYLPRSSLLEQHRSAGRANVEDAMRDIVAIEPNVATCTERITN